MKTHLHTPIISQIGTPTYEIAKSLNKIIVQYMPKRHMVESTYEMLNIVRTMTQRKKMTSLDADNLFTNVPVNTTIDIILEIVYENENIKPLDMPRNIMKQLLTICTTKENFKGIEGNIFRQKEGVSMGSPLGHTLANFYMCNLENKYSKIYH